MRLVTRNQKLFAPIMCSHCGEEIALGQTYWQLGDGRERHEGCGDAPSGFTPTEATRE